MSAVLKTIRVPPESELNLVLREAAVTGAPVRIDTGEAVYTVDVESPEIESEPELPPGDPTPEEIALSIEGINKATVGWVGLVDAEALKTHLRERRRTSSRPPGAW
jgi:hypothetical protein